MMNPLSAISFGTGQDQGCPFCSQQKSGSGLNPDDKQLVNRLKKRDDHVRKHEQAHLLAAGSFAASMPVYDNQEGPDGHSYAIGGHVTVDTSEISGNPQASKDKGEVLLKSALAPDDPSGADEHVADVARQMIARAQTQIEKQSFPGSKVSVVA